MCTGIFSKLHFAENKKHDIIKKNILFLRKGDFMRSRIKRIASLVLVFCLIVLGCKIGTDAKVIRGKASGTAVTENDQMVIDYSNITKGYVMVKYKKSTDVKLKAQVKCPTGIAYTYNLTAKKWSTFPLSEGDGEYKVTVYTNISGNTYATAGSQSFNAQITDGRTPFLMANQFVNYTSNTKCVKKAATLCKGTSSEMKKVKKIYDWVIKNFSYDTKKAKTVQSGYLPNLNSVYKAKKGICFDYAALMTAMLRSQGVPTKLVIGYAGSAYHAWISVYSEKDGWINNVIYFDGENWNLMDPTFASSSNSSPSVMKFIGDGSNYKAKYAY